jgi:hypothetical protein
LVLGTTIASVTGNKGEKIMKPISPTADNSRSFPLVEFSYQPGRLSGYQPRCAKNAARSFRNISSQYFQREARRDFVGEACLFVAIIVTAAAPFFNTASALADFCRIIGQF